jgi:hypothetical protein
MADDNRNIDDLINESFSDDFGDFDPESWGELNSRLEASPKGIDKLVFEAHIPVESVPDDSVWEGIQDALDVQTVWERIQQKWISTIKYGWYKIACLFLLFILSSYPLDKNQDYFKASNSVIAKNELNSSIGLEVVQKNDRKLLVSNSTVTDTVGNPLTNSLNSENGSYRNSTNKFETAKQNPQLPIIPELNFDRIELTKAIIRQTHLNTSSALLLAANSAKSNEINNSESDQKWVLGTFAEINDTWIMDPETRSGFLENSLVYNDISFAPSFGVFVNYNINQNYTLRSDVYINSRLKTRNNLYRSGKLVSKETELTYFKTSLNLGKKLKKKFSVYAGPYFSYLRTSNIKFDQVITEYNSSFSSIDYGIQLNLNREHKINDFYLAYGLNSSVGINNIFDGLNKPAYLNQTRNFTIGLNLRLGYNF